MAGRLLCLVFCSLFCLGLPGAALAQTSAPVALFPSDLPQPKKTVVTISVVSLILPVIELAAEHRVASNVGVAAMVGAGKLTDAEDNTFTVFEIGMSARYYALGSFKKGMQLGGAIEYGRIKGDNLNDSMISGVGSGVLAALFVGYKHTLSGGFTADVQIGPGFLVAQANADSGESAGTSRTFPYFNLDLGWSF